MYYNCSVLVQSLRELISYRACLQTVERFDPDMNLWSQVASMSSRRSFPGAAVHSNRLYVFGGNDGSAFLDIVEAYDPHLNRWHTIAPMTKPRAGIGRYVHILYIDLYY